MKNVNSRISILALTAFALILSSCSQQRYASRSYVKKEVVAQAEVKKQEVAQLPAIPAPQAQSAEAPQSIEPQPIEIQATQEANAPGSAIQQQNVQVPGFVQKMMDKHLNPDVNAKINKRIETLEKSGNITINHKGVRLIIIGLIVALVGIVLGIFIPKVEFIFGIVALILVVIGLILILMDLL